ncbi:MAG: hypothetical protein FWC47_02435 [Oscillospiraceae bacterium]|nr:hypothetical protein [Oscillospiraceae bacterium]
MALRVENKKIYWMNLENSKGLNLENIIFVKEIEQQKDDILHFLYNNKKHQDISLNKIVTYESNMDFINNATDFVVANIDRFMN